MKTRHTKDDDRGAQKEVKRGLQKEVEEEGGAVQHEQEERI